MKYLLLMAFFVSSAFASYNSLSVDKNFLSRAQISNFNYASTPSLFANGVDHFAYYGGQTYCAVGLNATSQGTAAHSGNGSFWIAGTGFANKAYQAVAANTSGTFVAVAYDASGSNEYMTSGDCKTWTTGTDANMAKMRDVIYANGMWVAVGQRIMTSTNGTTWTLRYTNPGSQEISSIAYGGGRFIAVIGNLADATGNVLTSTDGVTWTKPTDSDVISRALYSVTYGNGMFVAVQYGAANVVYSKDGTNWFVSAYSAEVGPSYNFPKISFNGSNFHIFIEGEIYTGKLNLIEWAKNYGPLCIYGRVKYDGKRYVGSMSQCATDANISATGAIFTTSGFPASF